MSSEFGCITIANGLVYNICHPTHFAVCGHLLRASYAIYMMTTLLEQTELQLNPTDFGFCVYKNLMHADNLTNDIPEQFAQIYNCAR